MRKGMKNFILLAAAVAMLASASVSHAGLLLAGNTQAGNLPAGGLIRGTVNFAVFDKTGGAPGDTWGTGDPTFDASFAALLGTGLPLGLDTTAPFLYLYQLSNESNVSGIGRLTFQATTAGVASITSLGAFIGRGFNDAGGDINGTVPGATVGNAVGPVNVVGDYVIGDGVTPLGGSGPLTITTQPFTFVGTAGGPGSDLRVPFSADLDAISGVIGIQLNSLAGTPKLAVGQTTTIVGFTSTLPPSFDETNVIDGSTARGTAPVPAPEAANIVSLISAGLVGLGFVLSKRSK